VIAGRLRERALRQGNTTLLVDSQGALSFADVLREVERLTDGLGVHAGRAVGLLGTRPRWLAPRLLALDALGARAHLLPGPATATPFEADGAGLSAILGESGDFTGSHGSHAAAGPGGVVIYTSGTTGVPKPAVHAWSSLSGRVPVRPDLEAARWLLSYGFSTFAGIQVFLHALLNGGTLVVGEGDAARMARIARDAGVTHMSGTPSFYRMLLAIGAPADLAGLRPRQITLGGEASDESLLDALKQRFPAARITQIYASTELGVCFSVNDGRAGFPASYVDSPTLGVQLTIVGGELVIASPLAMRGYLEPDGVRRPERAFATGDLVERRGDRVVFVGRHGQRISVGGYKAFPAEIEAAVMQVPGVRAVRASSARSSLVGELVRAEVVLEAGVEAGDARRSILAHCHAHLPPHLVPRLLEFVPALEHTAAGKLARR
jgi:acyl-coenzyme A synthetase/AMP-(fatty) acid ligase